MRGGGEDVEEVGGWREEENRWGENVYIKWERIGGYGIAWAPDEARGALTRGGRGKRSRYRFKPPD